MTSKNLFFRLVRQDIRKRIWCPIIIFITYFLVLEVRMLMKFESIMKYSKDKDYDLQHFVSDNLFGSEMIIFAVMICAAAFLCALGGFAYLHSKPQLDTYYSMPVSRRRLFWSQYVSGVLQCVVPLVFHVLVCMAIAASRAALCMEGMANGFCFIGTELLIFLMVYSAAIVAICLTGNLIISILGVGVLFSYSTLIALLKGALFEHFFHTYISFGYVEKFSLSPSGLMIRLKNQIPYDIKKGAYFQYSGLMESIALILIAVVIYTTVAYLLYQKRPSESAGKAIAFGWAEPVLKTLIVLPAMLLSGLFFETLSGFYGYPEMFRWFLFGAVFGFIILCLLVEIIFRMDIRGALEHKKQFAFNAACAALIIIIFRYDVLGYNTYVPLDKQLQSCAVSIDGLMEISPPQKRTRGWYTYTNVRKYRLETMRLQDNPSVMELVRKAAREGLNYAKISYYEGIEETQEYKEIMERQKNYTSITVGYRLLSGTMVYRYYVVDLSDAETVRLISDIFRDYQYKLGSVPMLSLESPYKNSPEILCNSNFCEQRLRLTEEKLAALLETYKEDLIKLTFEEAACTIPIGTISFLTEEDIKYQNYYNTWSLYDVYPQFTKTIALMKEYGFNYYETLSADEISEIRVRNYDVDINMEEHTETDIIVDMDGYVVYTQKDKIEEILNNIVNERLQNSSFTYIRRLVDDHYGIDIICSDGRGLPYGYDFQEGKVPDFVENDTKNIF